jgi:hypothetical protein
VTPPEPRPQRVGPALGALFRQVLVLLCALLASSGALELHNLANHHRDIEAGALVDRAASHPGIPHHFDHSDELREPACATCALQAQARGVHPDPAGQLGPAGDCPFDASAATAPPPHSLPSSASPRGPPAA